MSLERFRDREKGPELPGGGSNSVFRIKGNRNAGVRGVLGLPRALSQRSQGVLEPLDRRDHSIDALRELRLLSGHTTVVYTLESHFSAYLSGYPTILKRIVERKGT